MTTSNRRSLRATLTAAQAENAKAQAVNGALLDVLNAILSAHGDRIRVPAAVWRDAKRWEITYAPAPGGIEIIRKPRIVAQDRRRAPEDMKTAHPLGVGRLRSFWGRFRRSGPTPA